MKKCPMVWGSTTFFIDIHLCEQIQRASSGQTYVIHYVYN